MFFAKDYLFTRLKITAKEIKTNNLIVKMIPKAEELNEVVILDKKTTSISLSKEEIKEIKERLFHFDLKNRELFSRQIQQIQDKKEVLEIRKAFLLNGIDKVQTLNLGQV